MPRFSRALLCVALALTAACCVASAVNVDSRTHTCEGGEYHYQMFAPAVPGPLPAVLLLHGAGDQAVNFIETWEHIAGKKKIVLIAPQLPREAKFEPLAPAVFRCLVEDARQHAQIDPRRIYVFGHSMGGYLAFDAAMFQSEYFAAAAIHASFIDDDYKSILGSAKRKIPIALYIGDHDQYVPLDKVRGSRDLLHKEGFPVHYVEMQKHDHNYYDRQEQVTNDVWKFFVQYSLPDSGQ